MSLLSRDWFFRFVYTILILELALLCFFTKNPDIILSINLLFVFSIICVEFLRLRQSINSKYFQRFGYPLLISAIITLFFLHLSKFSFNEDNVFLYTISSGWTNLQKSDTYSSYIQITSTMYAVSVAFLLLKGIQDYEKMSETFNSLLSNIVSINYDLKYFDLEENEIYLLSKNDDIESKNKLDTYELNQKRIPKIRCSLVRFLKELKIMIDASHDRDVFSSKELNFGEIRGHVNKIEPIDFNDQLALEGIMHALNSSNSLLTSLYSSISDRMSNIILQFISAISVLSILNFYELEKFVFHPPQMFMMFTVSFMLIFLVILILDLNDPFDGQWRIKSEDIIGCVESINDNS